MSASSFPLEVWVATDDRRILLYAGADPENGSEVGRIMLPAAPLCQVIVHHQLVMLISSSYDHEIFALDMSDMLGCKRKSCHFKFSPIQW